MIRYVRISKVVYFLKFCKLIKVCKGSSDYASAKNCDVGTYVDHESA